MYYVNIKNENYGYAVATHGNYVAVGNPGVIRYNSATASATWSGSVDIFRYNKNLDQHDYIDTYYKDDILTEILLAAETGSDPNIA